MFPYNKYLYFKVSDLLWFLNYNLNDDKNKFKKQQNNMKNKNLKTILISACLFTGLNTTFSQCNTYGGSNPPITQVTGVSSQIGGYNLPNVSGFYNKKVVGDFDGNGIDDIFIISDEPNGTGVSSGTYARLFLSNGGGGFNLQWTSGQGAINLTSGSIDISIPGDIDIISGNFYGDNKDEVLIKKQLNSGQETTFWYLLGDINNATPTNLGSRSYDNPGVTGILPIIGSASINSRFFAANLIGDGHDELFSIYSGDNSWNIQTFNKPLHGPSNFNSNYTATGYIGSWQLNSSYFDDIYFANFDLNTSYDEIFTLRKSGSWAMLQNFNTTSNSFTLKWTDYGNSDFFMNNQCAPYSYNLQFNTSYDVYFGNMDNCDADVECLIIPNNDIQHPITLEFNSGTNAFRCWSVHWPTMNGSDNIAGTITSYACSGYERWTSRRYCTSTCLGICCHYTGGNSYITQRDFYNTNTKDGNLSFLLGNFYNNSYWNSGFNINTLDLIVFRNDIGSIVPLQMNGLTFLTNCSPDNMYGDYCPDNSNIYIYNLAGQYIASFNRNNGLFNTAAYKSGRYCMYSLTDPTTNLRTKKNVPDSTPTINIFHNPSLIESNEVENINLFDLNVKPNPSSEKITVSLKSNINLINNSVEIINIEGEIVSHIITNIYEGINIMDINVSLLNNGVYFVKYTTSNGEIYKSKFIKN
jgi:hypothetical protein